jgi:phosphatidylglycerol:prolipoprotein diacylglycerol transferase
LINIGISPIAFTIGPIEVRWYGIMIALAVLTVVLWVLREVRWGASISYDTVFTAALVAIPSGVILSRLLHVIDKWGYYSQNPGQIVGFSGLTIYGAILGATLAVWVYSRVSRFQFGYFADAVAPGIILAQAVGRVGCLLNGCCYGLPTSLPWGVVYTDPDSIGYNASFLLLPGTGLHPTQLYEIIYNLLVFGILVSLRRRLKPDGSLFLVYISLYSLWRFGIDFIRDGTPFIFDLLNAPQAWLDVPVIGFILGLHQAQVIGLIVLIIAIPILTLRTRWVKVAEKSLGEGG